jgi:hypothetical protein
MLEVRNDLIVIIKKIRRRERFLKELNYMLIKGDQIGHHNIQNKDLPSVDLKEDDDYLLVPAPHSDLRI